MVIPTLILRFISFFLLYLALAGSLDIQEIVTGALVSALLVWLGRHWNAGRGRQGSGLRALYAVFAYPMIFLKALVFANLDVARRVMLPGLPIKPGIVKVKTTLQSPLGRLILANSITLTPGTLTVESRDEWLFIHWIDVTDGSIEAATEVIVKQFEKHLEVLFG